MNGIEASTARCRTARSIIIESSASAGEAQVRVIDHGSGIDSDRAPHVFESFFTTKPDGMGMGLAISRSVAESHGGTLTIERTGPSGTTMVLTLPIPDQAAS